MTNDKLYREILELKFENEKLRRGSNPVNSFMFIESRKNKSIADAFFILK